MTNQCKVIVCAFVLFCYLKITDTTVDPCEHHLVLNSTWRNTEHWPGHHCHANISTGWYRLSFEGQSAVIPNRCIRTNACGVHIPFTINPNSDLTVTDENGTINAELCSSRYLNTGWRCCYEKLPIKIRSCNDFFIYFLSGFDSCSRGVCSEVPGQNISPLTVKDRELENDIDIYDDSEGETQTTSVSYESTYITPIASTTFRGTTRRYTFSLFRDTRLDRQLRPFNIHIHELERLRVREGGLTVPNFDQSQASNYNQLGVSSLDISSVTMQSNEHTNLVYNEKNPASSSYDSSIDLNSTTIPESSASRENVPEFHYSRHSSPFSTEILSSLTTTVIPTSTLDFIQSAVPYINDPSSPYPESVTSRFLDTEKSDGIKSLRSSNFFTVTSNSYSMIRSSSEINVHVVSKQKNTPSLEILQTLESSEMIETNLNTEWYEETRTLLTNGMMARVSDTKNDIALSVSSNLQPSQTTKSDSEGTLYWTGNEIRNLPLSSIYGQPENSQTSESSIENNFTVPNTRVLIQNITSVAEGGPITGQTLMPFSHHIGLYLSIIIVSSVLTLMIVLTLTYLRNKGRSGYWKCPSGVKYAKQIEKTLLEKKLSSKRFLDISSPYTDAEIMKGEGNMLEITPGNVQPSIVNDGETESRCSQNGCYQNKTDSVHTFSAPSNETCIAFGRSWCQTKL